MRSKKVRIAGFFLNEAHPYSKKRTIKIVHVVGVLVIMAVVVLAIGSYFDRTAAHEREVAEAAKAAARGTSQTGVGLGQAAAESNHSYLDNSVPGYGNSKRGGNRQYNASQLIKRGGGFGDVLPMGTL